MNEQSKLVKPHVGGYQPVPGGATLQIGDSDVIPNEYVTLINCIGEVYRIAITNMAIEVKNFQEFGPKLLNFKAGFYSCLERLTSLLEAQKGAKLYIEDLVGFSSEYKMTRERQIVRLVNASILTSSKTKADKAASHKKAAEDSVHVRAGALLHSNNVLGRYISETEKLLKALQEVKVVFAEELA